MRESVRVAYCHLWNALVLQNDSEVAKYSLQLGVRNWQIFALSVLMRPYNRDVGFQKLVSKQQLEQVRQLFEKSLNDMMQAFEDMPRELLLVLRTQNYLRSLNHELNHPVNRFRIMAKTAVRGIRYRNWDRTTEEDVLYFKQHSSFILKHRFTLLDSINTFFHTLSFELHLILSDIFLRIGEIYMRWTHLDKLILKVVDQDDPISENDALFFGG